MDMNMNEVTERAAELLAEKLFQAMMEKKEVVVEKEEVKEPREQKIPSPQKYQKPVAKQAPTPVKKEGIETPMPLATRSLTSLFPAVMTKKAAKELLGIAFNPEKTRHTIVYCSGIKKLTFPIGTQKFEKPGDVAVLGSYKAVSCMQPDGRMLRFDNCSKTSNIGKLESQIPLGIWHILYLGNASKGAFGGEEGKNYFLFINLKADHLPPKQKEDPHMVKKDEEPKEEPVVPMPSEAVDKAAKLLKDKILRNGESKLLTPHKKIEEESSMQIARTYTAPAKQKALA